MDTAWVRHLRAPLVFALAFALAAGAAAVARTPRGGTEQTVPPYAATRVPDPMAMFDPSVPLMPHGRMTTIEEAATAAGYAIPRPSNLGPPEEVWIVDYGGGVREVGLRYPAYGVTVLVSRFPPGRRVGTDAWARARVEGLPLAYVTSIAGHPAAVLPYDPALAAAPIDVVYVAMDSLEVIIYGDHTRTDIAELLAAASTLSA